MTLEQRLTVLEKRLDGYIGSQNIKAKYDGYDKDGLRHTDGEHGEKIDEHSEAINESEDVLDGLMTEIIPETTESLSEVEDAIDDLMTNIIPSLMENNAEP